MPLVPTERRHYGAPDWPGRQSSERRHHDWFSQLHNAPRRSAPKPVRTAIAQCPSQVRAETCPHRARSPRVRRPHAPLLAGTVGDCVLKVAAVLGASGNVGRSLVNELSAHATISRIILINRRDIPELSRLPKVQFTAVALAAKLPVVCYRRARRPPPLPY